MPFELVAMGGSWGGTRATAAVLEALPAEFELPIVVALHRGPSDDSLLERAIERSSKLEVVPATDKQPLERGRVYLAPPDYHLLVEPGHLALSTDEIVQFARPSIDVLFESVAAAYGPRAVGVLLTGVNEDGAAGLGQMASAGAFTIAQDPESAEQGEMPAAAVARGAARRVLPLERIGPFLAELRSGVAR